jgi:hypothetical protein
LIKEFMMTNEEQKPVAPTSNPATAPQKPQHNQGDSKPGSDKSDAQPQQK